MIYLFKNKNHFDVITSMPAFLCKDYFCHSCKKTYSHRDKHRCPSKCIACYKYFPKGNKCSGEQITCNDCRRTFFSQSCFDEHKRNRSQKDGNKNIVCDIVFKCLKCDRTLTTSKDVDIKNHTCGFSKCSNCKIYCDLTRHQCHMKNTSCKGGDGSKTYTEKYMFFDFECNQETGVHEVNLAVVKDFEGKEWVFKDSTEFCNFVFSDKNKGYTLIAHNSRGYDSQFILKWCVENSIKPYCIYAGTKIMSMEIASFGIRIIDSLNFVQSRLKDFPKTFGLTELKKGFFPHYFNKDCHKNYVGPLPAKKHYGLDQMSIKDRKDFQTWHDTCVKENYVFDFQKELLGYCRSDVDILRRSMLKFRKDFINLENIDPLQYVTIASVCMTIYRSNYMPTDYIAVVKDNTRRENYSKMSIAWLDWIEEEQGIKIKHALNGGELSIRKIGKVDGYCKDTNTVYEFQGCFWHGCRKCYNSDTINIKNQIDMLTLRKRTFEKNDRIKSAGFNLVEVFECDLNKDSDFKKFMKTWDRDIVGPLNPRDAFFGGRTNVTKLTYDFKKTEKGRYVDFVSLYPTVQYYKRYPVGHPVKILEPLSYDSDWFGFIKCKVLPPRGLYHPVLPVKVKCGPSNKLLFPLCKSCAETKQQKCNHSDSERSFIGTWCTNEVEMAIEKGYEVQKVYEVWHFNKSSENLFKEYVRKFIKIKMESSPLTVGPDCKYKTIDHFKKVVKDKLDIELGEIKHNPGMRAIAKMCLNSLWGKFGQRNNMKKTDYVTEPSEFYRILLDDSVDDLNIQFINNEMLQMTYNLKDQFVDNSNSTNIFIAAFTTSHARQMLYGVLDKLDNKVLGFDTDSVWYVEREGDVKIETGDSLGDLTDELDDNSITEWVATGPKSYSYNTSDGKSVCKVKGFTLNYENSKCLNMDGMRRVINNTADHITIINEGKITRDPSTKQIVNRYLEKDFRFVYDKRCMVKTGTGIDTLPYGY